MVHVIIVGVRNFRIFMVYTMKSLINREWKILTLLNININSKFPTLLLINDRAFIRIFRSPSSTDYHRRIVLPKNLWNMSNKQKILIKKKNKFFF